MLDTGPLALPDYLCSEAIVSVAARKRTRDVDRLPGPPDPDRRTAVTARDHTAVLGFRVDQAK